MKAIVMAGGEGTRLRPLTADMPKPMAPIMGRSVLEHMLRLLKKNGVDRVLITLGYMAAPIERWAATSPVEGLEITCRREDTPLGTAGSVRAARDWLAGEEFLVVSGDAVCDFDLAACVEHRHKTQADALLVLTQTEDPGEYGSVVCSKDGRIQRFIEKPQADKVATDMINTGIYALSPRVLDMIADDGPCDFGRDVFPRMLDEGLGLYGLCTPGYWCDMGSIPAYLGCCRDALEGRIHLDPAAPLQRRGVWAFDPLPEKATILPPVYIGRGCVIEPGAVIGPNAILEDGSTAAAGARVTNSVVMGAALRRGALVGGSWLGQGAVIGERAIVSDGCAVGSSAVAGACSMLESGTRLWPKRDVPPGERVGGSFEDRPVRGPLRFETGGVIRGEWNAQISPEAAFALGCGASRLGNAAVACGEGGAAQLVLAALECGLRTGGGDAVRTDADHEWAAARAGALLELPLGIFVREKNGLITISFYGPQGRRLSRADERRIEAGAAGSLRIASAERLGSMRRMGGVMNTIAELVARRMTPGNINLNVDGPEAESALLRRALELAEVSVHENGGPILTVEEGGFALTGRDEQGRRLFARDCVMLSLLARLEAGAAQAAVPDWAPRAAQTLADSFGAQLSFESGGAEASSAHFMAADIINALTRGNTMTEMTRRLPPYAVMECEVPLRAGAAAMRRLQEQCNGVQCGSGAGLQLEEEHAFARVSRSGGGVRISAESEDMETAKELCFRLRDILLKNE